SGPSASGRAPVVLLHGSPSSGGKDFAQFAPLLVAAGYTVFAPDLPGFGASQGRAPDYSIRANARLTLAAVQDLGIERARVVGWSLGGGAAMCMADLDPQRIASLTLLGSVGLQETEGSGDYFFERVKYHVVQALVVGLPEAI